METQWEYLVVDSFAEGMTPAGEEGLQEHLNCLGEMGWELTCCLPARLFAGVEVGLLFLKRKRSRSFDS